MPKNLPVSMSKTLKLTNVIMKKCEEEDLKDLQKTVIQMSNFIQSKGMKQVGPLIQRTGVEFDSDGNPQIAIWIMLQSSQFIQKIEKPYQIESGVKVPDCLYVHYAGLESDMRVAYEKLHVCAYEEEINLSGDNYTVFINQEDDMMTADIFMEKKLDE